MTGMPMPISNEAALPPATVRRIGAVLAFVAGFVDTVGFVALFGLFTAHVTGNFVVIGASMVEHRSGLLTKLLALPTFVIAVALCHLVMAHRLKAGRQSHQLVLAVQAGLLAAFMMAGLHAAPIVNGDQPWPMAAGLLGVAAMAVQNAASRVPFKDFTPTTVMTGNTTQLVMDAVDMLRGVSDAPVRTRFVKTWPIVLGFGLGCASGALGVVLLGFASLSLPIVLLIVLALRWPRAGSHA